jgi:DNA-binding NtrC family response regulator
MGLMVNEELSILLAEDDLLTLRTNARILAKFGRVVSVSNFEDATTKLVESRFDVAFFDLNLHGELHGLELIKRASADKIYSVVISAESRGKILEQAFQNGAKDYLLKPFSEEKLQQVLNRFLNNRKHFSFEAIINEKFITKSTKQIDELYKLKNLPISDKPIFVSGETGTGKRVVAHIIKGISDQKTFIELNCSQFNDDLIASELFGHVKGAFTGATENKDGLLLKANNGIIFLDEIHALSLKSQKTLLKAIEEKEFYPVGSSFPLRSNFRVISATCENIESLIEMGKFREDLYARISTFKVNLMPLRERKEDIDLLISYYLSKHLVQVYINDDAKTLLKKYSWPRNTREIEDLVENWIVSGQRLITPDVLPSHVKHNLASQCKFIPDHYLDLVEEHSLNNFLTYFKKEIIQEMVKRHGSIRSASDKMGSSHSNTAAYLRQNRDLNLLIRRLNEKH